MNTPDELQEILDALCPMHVVLDATGHIAASGGTVQKLFPDRDLSGTRFLELFELKRPHGVTSMAGLLGTRGQRLHLLLRGAPRSTLKGVLVPLPMGGAVVNLSFGISVLDAVRDYALTSADFAATDLAIEMLYLVEAKSAAMEASRKLNLRLQGAMIAAEEQAFTDTLTGLKNRRALDYVMERMLGAKVPFALMHLDLDYFKTVNDTLGHAAGDLVLQKVARVMVEQTRDQDTVARVGGDEFVLVFNEVEDRRRLMRIAARMIEQLEEPIPFEGHTCHISASIGITLTRDYDAPDADEMMNDADAALYAAKRAGRGCARLFEEGMTAVPDSAAADASPPPGTRPKPTHQVVRLAVEGPRPSA